MKKELAPYLEANEDGPRLAAWLAGIARASQPTVDFLVELNGRLRQSVDYTVRLEAGVQTGEETLTKASGSCRDSAWLLVQVLRHLGLAARFVSGYLVQLAADEKSLDGPSGPERDFTDLHAWAEVYVPGAGWVGLDPTSGLFAGESHIPLACAPHPTGAAPIDAMDAPEWNTAALGAHKRERAEVLTRAGLRGRAVPPVEGGRTTGRPRSRPHRSQGRPRPPGTRRQAVARGLDVPVGQVLPLAWDGAAGRWRSAPWVFKRGRLYLVPGDSPLGLRLPLDSLPWDAAEQVGEADPFAP